MQTNSNSNSEGDILPAPTGQHETARGTAPGLHAPNLQSPERVKPGEVAPFQGCGIERDDAAPGRCPGLSHLSPLGLAKQTASRATWTKRRFVAAVALIVMVAAGAFFLTRRADPVPGELPRAALVLTNGRLCLKDGGAPFTGLVFERTTGGQRLTELQLRDGIVHGLAKGWFDSGAKEVEESFENGISNGLRRRWHENGQLKNEATIVHGELHGPYTEWHADGTLAVRMNNVQGKGEGLCEAWHPGGAPKAKVTLAAGKPVTKEYFSNPGAPSVPAALTTTNISISAAEVLGE